MNVSNLCIHTDQIEVVKIISKCIKQGILPNLNLIKITTP